MRAALAILLLAALAACSSSAKSSSAPSTTAGGSCPFQGSTSAQTTPAGPVPSVEVASVTPRRAGCIDQVHFGFTPALAATQSAYEGTTLRVRFMGASLGSGVPGGSLPTDGLAYVRSITLDQSAPAGEVDFLVELDKVRPFLVSSSQGPPEMEVAIG